MRALIDIVTGYEGAIQEVNDDSSDENIAALELARAELLQVLLLAKAWEETNNLLHQNNLDALVTSPDATGFSL